MGEGVGGRSYTNLHLQLLAMHGPFFDALYFGAGKEGEQDVVELKDVDAFEAFLNFVFFTGQMINGSTDR